jgi:putative sigma-54 modulation protein
MELELQVRHFDLTDTVRDYVQRKVGRLDRHLPGMRATRVELARGVRRSQGDVYTAQMTSWVDSAILRAEEMNVDLFAAIDLASDKLLRQVERYKGKRRGKRYEVRRGAGELEEGAPAETQAEVEAEVAAESGAHPVIARRKRFPIIPMTEQEAIDQLELLGHDFFLFLNADSGMVNVLYRRWDGELGLIEPERG